MFSLGQPREFHPSGREPSTRSYVLIARRIEAPSSSRSNVHASVQRHPWPSRSWSCSRIQSVTAGLSSSATAAADTVTGTSNESKMRASRQTPARLPYS